MTPKTTKAVLKLYLELLGEPVQMPEEYYYRRFEDIPLGEATSRCHAAWMCREALKFVDDGRMEKAMRWLGWINDAVWRSNLLTLAEIKAVCMNDEARER